MIGKIEPIHDDIQSCYEIIISTVAKWLGKEYDLMFSEYWGFSFKKEFWIKKIMKLGYFLDAQIGPCENSLEKYHGIKISRSDVGDSKEYFQEAINQISLSMPVCIKIDKFWCPWSNTYQSIHGKHFSLIFGVDYEKQSFICLDPFFNVNGDLLPFENFYTGCKGLSVFSLVDEGQIVYNWQDIVKNSIDRLYQNDDINGTSFAQMKSFSMAMKESLDVALETRGEKQIFLSPFFLKFRSMARGRQLFSKTLKYLGERYNPDLLEPASQLNQAGLDLTTIHAMLLKLSHNNKNEKRIIEDACRQFDKIIEREISLAETLKFIITKVSV